MKKILIISSNRLGDCILTSGLIEYYKKKYKKSKITFACGELPASLFKYSINITKLIIIKKLRYSIHWVVFWCKVIFNFWDIVLDLRGTGISYFLFSKQRIIKPFCVAKNQKKKLHKVISLSKYFGKKTLSPYLKINYDINKSKILLDYTNKANDLIALAPGANWVAKQWPKENFLLLIKNLQSNRNFKNSIFILLGSENEFESGLYIKSKLRKKKIENLIGILNLAEIYILLKKCKLFLGNDSGLMHLAALSGIPTIGLFGPSDKNQYHPWGQRTLAISTPESPETLMNNENFSHKSTKNLMKTLTVNSVTFDTLNFYNKINV